MTMPVADPSSADDGIAFVDLLRILRRRGWIIVLTVVVLTAVPVAYGLMLVPQYTAATSIIIEPADSGMIVGQIRPIVPPDKTALEAHAEILRSRALILRAMEDLELFDDPEFMIAEADHRGATAALSRLADVAADRVLDRLRGWLNLPVAVAETVESTIAATPEPSGLAERPGDKDLAAELFASQLDVSYSEGSYVLRVAFTSADPVKAATVTNQVAKLFIRGQLREKQEAARRTGTWLGAQLPLQQQEVLEAERLVAEFRSEHQLLAGRAGSLIEAQMHEVSQAMVQTRAARSEKEAKLRQVRALEAGGSNLDALADVIASPLVSALRRREAELLAQDAQLATAFGSRHPTRQAISEETRKLSAQISEEVGRIVRSLQNDIAVLSTQEHSLRGQLTAANDQNKLDNQAGVRLQELERAAAAKRARYEMLLRRFQETSGQEGILEAGARVLSRAEVPSEPTTPAPSAFAAVGFAASAILGCMLALLVEQSDKSLRRVRQVERMLKVPCLSLLPNVPGLRRKERLHDALWKKPGSAYPQAVRSLYVRIAAIEPRPKVLLVTSALPEEGKTSLSSAIALCAAQIGGSKTLLIDFDLWRPRVSDEFRLAPAVGVAELIVAESLQDFERALRPIHREGVDILTAGLRPADGSRKLTIQSVSKLIGELRKRYDFIVIDSPPILGVNDGHILAMAADKALFAVRWGRTSRDAAVAALKILRDVSSQVLGVVLTRVDTHTHVHYGEGDELQFHKQFQKYYAREA